MLGTDNNRRKRRKRNIFFRMLNRLSRINLKKIIATKKNAVLKEKEQPVLVIENLEALENAEIETPIPVLVVENLEVLENAEIETPISALEQTSSISRGASTLEQVSLSIGSMAYHPKEEAVESIALEAITEIEPDQVPDEAKATADIPVAAVEQEVKEPIAGQLSIEHFSSEFKKYISKQKLKNRKQEISTSLDRVIDGSISLVKRGFFSIITLFAIASISIRRVSENIFSKLSSKIPAATKEKWALKMDIRRMKHARRMDIVETACAGVVNRIDITLDRLAAFVSKICYRVNREYRKIAFLFEYHRKKLIIAGSCAMVVFLGLSAGMGLLTAYEYSYNGKALGVVKSEQDVYEIADIIQDKLAKEYDVQISIDKQNDISFKKIIGANLDIASKEDILNSFTYLKDVKATAYAIVLNEEILGIVQNENYANEVLDSLMKKYQQQSDDVEYDYVGFAEPVIVKEIETEVGNLQNQKEIVDSIMSGGVEQKVHVVQQGQTFSEIASSYNITQDSLAAQNPSVEPAKLKIGQEIVLSAEVPLLTVETIETATYVEDVPYSITYENTALLYEGEKTVKLNGTNGSQRVVAQITRNNGIEISRKQLSAEVLSQPTAQIVLVGTKELPPLIGTGTFINPTRGKLTSRYGTRWGRMHEGIDIGAPTGTPIYAADGGTVIEAGWHKSYGYMIRIDHGGNRVTTYAHCSKLHVKKGTKVYQGQHIANVGNTGRSTGPHLHFEVRINGKLQNPLNYVY